MRFTERQRIVIETNLARDRAETLLCELLDASRGVQIHNVTKARPAMDCADGLDRAVSAARRLIGSLNDALALSEADLIDDEMSLVDEFSLLDPVDELDDVDSAAFEALLRDEGVLVENGVSGDGLEQTQQRELVAGSKGRQGSTVPVARSGDGESGLATASDSVFDMPV